MKTDYMKRETQVTRRLTRLLLPHGGAISMRPRALWTMQYPQNHFLLFSNSIKCDL